MIDRWLFGFLVGGTACTATVLVLVHGVSGCEDYPVVRSPPRDAAAEPDADALPAVDWDARETTAVETGDDAPKCSCACVPALGNACPGWDGGACHGLCCDCSWSCAPLGCSTPGPPHWCCP